MGGRPQVRRAPAYDATQLVMGTVVADDTRATHPANLIPADPTGRRGMLRITRRSPGILPPDLAPAWEAFLRQTWPRNH